MTLDDFRRRERGHVGVHIGNLDHRQQRGRGFEAAHAAPPCRVRSAYNGEAPRKRRTTSTTLAMT